MTVKELRQMAKDYELKGYSGLKKAELIEFLQEAGVLMFDDQTGEMFDGGTDEGYYTDEQRTFKNADNAATFFGYKNTDELQEYINKSFEVYNDCDIYWTQAEAVQPEGYGGNRPPSSPGKNKIDPLPKKIGRVSVDLNGEVTAKHISDCISIIMADSLGIAISLRDLFNKCRTFSNELNEEVFDGETFYKEASEWYGYKCKKFYLKAASDAAYQSLLKSIQPVQYMYFMAVGTGHYMYPIIQENELKQGA